jgi:hypothetical protein
LVGGSLQARRLRRRKQLRLRNEKPASSFESEMLVEN